jgi:hypothetical protein
MNNEPIKVQSEEIINPEQRLWRAVLSQAVDDAFGPARYEKTQKDRREAQVFLTDYEDVSFVTVCENAGFNPSYIKDKVEKTIDKSNIDRNYLEVKGVNYAK